MLLPIGCMSMAWMTNAHPDHVRHRGEKTIKTNGRWDRTVTDSISQELATEQGCD